MIEGDKYQIQSIVKRLEEVLRYGNRKRYMMPQLAYYEIEYLVRLLKDKIKDSN